MPSSRPPANDLLAVVMEYLDTDIAPRVPAVQRFQLKIVARALSTVKRELEPQLWSTKQPWFADMIGAMQKKISSK